ncbi:YheC/YheD family protein [Ammoniphilus sp. CFH 90114]|uniref:YheC/YheD family endospore coat-associated protein n=1 Tax=Ammoniphilus sp. CFH 90114 TaxID=2493665 RepID=UPI00100FD4E6|nr:YheC/YheD family protein [Ammoniphilus sp. CFH 90114]RXT08772.1 YheC/YheD family protein [Ammoniphilus sp. CFH 90114]
MEKRVLGIMVHQVNDPHRFHPLASIALEEGFSTVIVYTPKEVNLTDQFIFGYIYEYGRWIKHTRPFPSINHDIGYYPDLETLNLVKKIKNHPHLPFLGYGLGNKWTIQQHLLRSRQLSPYLLPTAAALNLSSIIPMLKKHQTVMLKPLNGKGGTGIIKLSIKNQGYSLEENNKEARYVSEQELHRILSELIRTERYLVQKWIDIRDHKGSVYDIRVLMQKNGLGKWVLTGMGVRQGNQEKITSNLTGGGQAFPVYPYLKEQFTEPLAKILNKKIEQIAYLIPRYLEKAYRKRLVELGLDIAVDRKAKIWIIEVNIKPGRTLWRKISDWEADRTSLRNPIQYAKYLLDRMEKGAP